MTSEFLGLGFLVRCDDDRRMVEMAVEADDGEKVCPPWLDTLTSVSGGCERDVGRSREVARAETVVMDEDGSGIPLFAIFGAAFG